MLHPKLLLVLVIPLSSVLAQEAHPELVLPAPTVLPIIFSNTIGAKSSRPGDIVLARTTQIVSLQNGATIPRGAKVAGHVIAASPFIYDKTPYARQKQSILSVHFDSVTISSTLLPAYCRRQLPEKPILLRGELLRG